MKSSWSKANRRRKKESLERYLRLQKKQTAQNVQNDCSSAHVESEEVCPPEDNQATSNKARKSVKDSGLYREWLKKKNSSLHQQNSKQPQNRNDVYSKHTSGSEQYAGQRQTPASGRDMQRGHKNNTFPLLINIKRRYLRIAVCLLVFLGIVAFGQSDSRLSAGIRQTVAYILTTEFDYQPALDRIASGLQNINISVPTLGGNEQQTGDAEGTSATSNSAGQLPTTGTASGTAVAGDAVAGTEKDKETKTADEQAVAVSTLKVGTLPVSGTVALGYGWVADELDGLQRFHEGIDIIAEAGSEIKAVAAGTVDRIGSDPELGAYVLLRHEGEGNYSLYAQLAEIMVKEGDELADGTQIGTLGAAVDGSEPHLHFEIRENNQLLDPLTKMDMSAV